MNIEALSELMNVWALLLIPAITAVVSIVKGLIPEPYRKKAAPGISLLIGVALGLFMIGSTKLGGAVGGIMGLAASGLWSTAVSPFKKAKAKPQINF